MKKRTSGPYHFLSGDVKGDIMSDEKQQSHWQPTSDTVSRLINAVLAAGVIFLGGLVVSNNTELAAMKTRMESFDMRVQAVRGDIGDRYRRSDAQRDHQEVKSDLRRESDNIESWVQKINERLHGTETEVRMLAHLQEDIGTLDDRVREIEKQAPEFLNNDLHLTDSLRYPLVRGILSWLNNELHSDALPALDALPAAALCWSASIGIRTLRSGAA